MPSIPSCLPAAYLHTGYLHTGTSTPLLYVQDDDYTDCGDERFTAKKCVAGKAFFRACSPPRRHNCATSVVMKGKLG
jgi:hypothetical protein